MISKFHLLIIVVCGILLAAAALRSQNSVWVVERFSPELQTEKGIEGWDVKSFVGYTQYSIVQDDSNFVLRAQADSAASGLFKEIKYDLKEAPVPERSIFKKDLYRWDAHHVMTSRGCPVRCIGCPLPAHEGFSFRYRPIPNIIEDIKQMKYQEFYFIEDTLMLPGKRSQKFVLNIMEQTRGMDVKIFLASTMMMKHEFDFYTKLKQGGASSMYTVFGFDKVSKQLLSKECTKDEWQKGVDLVRMIEDNGIHFYASFGIGFDDQDRIVVDKILKFSHDAKIDLAEFYILTPFPGTPFGVQTEKEKRILHRNYSSWNHGNVIFKPLHWTEEELINDFYTLWREFYKNINPNQTTRTFNLCSVEKP